MNSLINLYESCDKLEKAEKWRAKLLQIEAARERHVTTKTISIS